jgi:2'-5' RNA ligase
MDSSDAQTAGFTLRFDAATERAIIDLWLALAEEGVEPLGLSGYRPHISLAAYETRDPDAYRLLLESFAREITAFPIRFDALGIFPAGGVVYLAPTVSDALFAVHRSLIERLQGAGATPVPTARLGPGEWAPHCTLMAGATPGMVAGAIAFLYRQWRVIEGTVEGIGVLVPPDIRDRYDAPFQVP